LIVFPTKEGDWIAPDKLVAAWNTAYGEKFCNEEMAKMAAWLFSNPRKQKTLRGMPRFVNSWLSRSRSHFGKSWEY
jgi:hypothetical protein